MDKKNILFVIGSLNSGGAERVMTILANELSRDLYKITIFSKSKDSPFYDLEQEVQLVQPKTDINYKNKLTILQGRLKVYLEIFKNIKRYKFDLVIPFSTTTNGVIIVICKLIGIPVIASEHSNYKVKLNLFNYRFIKKRIYPFANYLTVLTMRDKNEFYGKFMKNVIVMPNPLPLTPVKVNSQIKREKVILAIGGLSRWKVKGLDNLIKIYAQVLKRNSGWRLQIAGGGDASYLKKITKKLNLEEEVEFLGQVKDVQKLMKKSSIYVLTSRREGLPMGLLEAMSQGMACIAFDCYTGPRDMITHNYDGILVEDQNMEKMVTQLLFLINDESKRKYLGLNSIKTSKEYLPHIIVEKWKSLINLV